MVDEQDVIRLKKGSIRPAQSIEFFLHIVIQLVGLTLEFRREVVSKTTLFDTRSTSSTCPGYVLQRNQGFPLRDFSITAHNLLM